MSLFGWHEGVTRISVGHQTPAYPGQGEYFLDTESKTHYDWTTCRMDFSTAAEASNEFVRRQRELDRLVSV